MRHLVIKPWIGLCALVLTFWIPPSVQAADAPGELKAKASDCFACHAVDRKVVGPAYVDVAKKYAGQGDAIVSTLIQKIHTGGSGNWGDIPMTPHPQMSDADLREIVKWILSLKGDAVAAPNPASAKTYTYKAADGTSVTTDFPVFTSADQKQVTDGIFHGYEQFNSYCFRCHGTDATGSEYAPDLRDSVSKSMTFQLFLSTAMTGRQDKGMPAWAGFFEEKDIRDIYEYVKSRQLNLIQMGRPPSGGS
jgi:cytochrome c